MSGDNKGNSKPRLDINSGAFGFIPSEGFLSQAPYTSQPIILIANEDGTCVKIPYGGKVYHNFFKAKK